ncbi:MAG: MFS transporter [Planctomycetota bacterium]|nr:MFS transporter [Planctomycetota bacterium]MDA1212573.1 MFS transporter [Planctomycetota bacterium]
MNSPAPIAKKSDGKWMALLAALLGWMFDGLEIGLFPLVARPSLKDLVDTETITATAANAQEAQQMIDGEVGMWIGIATAAFLIGAASGGVLFGWLGDRIGRVRAMTLSVLTYAIFSGLCGVAISPEMIVSFRFLSALGMGGEWSLGVALVMEIWPDRSRGFLAGLIGAAANVGFLLIALFGLVLGQQILELEGVMLSAGLPQSWVTFFIGAEGHKTGWRLLMLLGASPALLTFFIRLFVPESAKWEQEKGAGKTSHWATRDLIGVLIGALSALTIIYFSMNKLEWAGDYATAVRIIAILTAVSITTVGYMYPVVQYLLRMKRQAPTMVSSWGSTIGHMLLGAMLSGVALMGTWGSLQWAVPWADQLAEAEAKQLELPAKEVDARRADARSQTQIWSAIGAIIGTILAAVAGQKYGRRITYFSLCLMSQISALWFFLGNDSVDTMFLISVFIAGATTASFYGWLPLYLPELFRTNVRATGQGFSFNFGRIIAAVGALQTGNLMARFEYDQVFLGTTIPGGYPLACSVMSLIYVIGMVVIWFAPETHGKPLPE